MPQFSATTFRSSDMPTPRKKRPSNRPRNGSMSASSWWRKLDSDSSTPATKAPMAMDRPPISISRPAPSTTSSAAAVMTSRARLAASTRNRGLSTQRPAATRALRLSRAMPMVCHSGVACAAPSGVPGARNSTRASSGTISRSSNSRMETMRWPRGVASSCRSPSTCMTMAVEVSTKPEAQMKDTSHEAPNRVPTMVSRMALMTTCRLPSPKICRRRPHRCEGFISSPMTNRNITTPNSAMWMMECESVTRARP